MSVAVVIPFNSKEEWRIKAFNWILAWWANNTDYEVLQGWEDPYTKGSAAHNGVAETDASTLIIADADCFIENPGHILDYVSAVESGQFKWVIPHKKVYRIPEELTEKLYQTGTYDLRQIGCYNISLNLGGGMVVLSRAAWETVNGIDPRFMGWGGEDVSFGWALRCLVGEPTRGFSNLVHLYHPKQGPRQEISSDNVKLMNRYQAANRDKIAMRKLVGEHDGGIG